MARYKSILKKTFILIILLTSKSQAQFDVNFMTFNVWQEGTSVTNGLVKIRDVIAKVNPDIVGFTEVRNFGGQDWTTKIINELAALGLNYHRGYKGGDVSIISKFPILESKLVYNGEGSIASFDINIFGKTVMVACGHLDYTYYACYLPRGYNGGSPNWNMIDDGTGKPKPVTDINQILSYNLLSTRDEQVKALLNHIKSKTVPIIFMGDFNEPSHLDWTEKTSSLFDHSGMVIPWQNTRLLADSGFIDSYRAFFPNELHNPGITWPSYAHGKGTTSWTPLADERDRIDYIFYKGSEIQTTYVTLVGPRESYENNQLSTTFTNNENFIADTLAWPSDHKALLTTLSFSNITKVNDFDYGAKPMNFNLENNYPNPFNSSTLIPYTLNNPSHVSLNIYDISGRIIETLITEYQMADRYVVEFDANKYASGIYFYKFLIGNEYLETKKMILIR